MTADLRHEPSPETSLRGALLDGRYRVIGQLAEGGMATVYSAVDERDRRLVVAKVPHPELLRRRGFRLRFAKEIRSLIKLRHPRIVKVQDVGDFDGTPYAILQHLAGGTLDDVLERLGRPQSPDEVCAWLRDVAPALDYIHDQGLIHRDVKPDNVLFDDQGGACLADFGLIRIVNEAGPRLTSAGMTPGTPEFMAPEQGLQDRLTPAADQYSLAATVYCALAGRPPHTGDTPIVVMSRKNLEDPPALSEVVQGLPEAASRAVMRGLARSPDERFESCEALARAFERGLQQPAAPRKAWVLNLRDVWIPVVGAFVVVAAALAVAMAVEHWRG